MTYDQTLNINTERLGWRWFKKNLQMKHPMNYLSIYFIRIFISFMEVISLIFSKARTIESLEIPLTMCHISCSLIRFTFSFYCLPHFDSHFVSLHKLFTASSDKLCRFTVSLYFHFYKFLHSSIYFPSVTSTPLTLLFNGNNKTGSVVIFIVVRGMLLGTHVFRGWGRGPFNRDIWSCNTSF